LISIILLVGMIGSISICLAEHIVWKKVFDYSNSVNQVNAIIKRLDGLGSTLFIFLLLSKVIIYVTEVNLDFFAFDITYLTLWSGCFALLFAACIGHSLFFFYYSLQYALKRGK
jgi:hypothetical protein